VHHSSNTGGSIIFGVDFYGSHADQNSMRFSWHFDGLDRTNSENWVYQFFSIDPKFPLNFSLVSAFVNDQFPFRKILTLDIAIIQSIIRFSYFH
jgi:hypothetical protein